MAHPAKRIPVTDRQEALLIRLVNRKKTPQHIAERARIVLMSGQGVPAATQGERLCVDEQRVRRWRKRWSESKQQLVEAEAQDASDKDFEALVVAVLSDAKRPGGPARITPEQLTQILALACEKPADLGLPISHWTPKELAKVAMEQGLVDQISPRHLGRFLK